MAKSKAAQTEIDRIIALKDKKSAATRAAFKGEIDMEADANKVTDTSVAALMELVKRQIKIEDYLSDLADKSKKAQENLRNLTEVEIPAFFDEAGGIKEITLPDGTKVTVETKVYPNIAADNWDEAVVWLKENNFDSLIKNEIKITFGKGEDEKAEKIMELLVKKKVTDFTNKQFIHPQTLGAFVRERLLEGADLPLAININPVRKSTIKKPKLK